MLRYARENVSGMPLRGGRRCEFSIGQKFAAAYSVFESLNHIPDLDGLANALK